MSTTNPYSNNYGSEERALIDEYPKTNVLTPTQQARADVNNMRQARMETTLFAIGLTVWVLAILALQMGAS